ncbi:5-formyltetrahydrofolate cyclo-ligase [Enhydrobacter aerosaccus]|uniref:5-formyltetrahydrofolate cyclo-ligase n=1 Tax=Enhydrobacter aerosaccus TaxID=225324 RepID=A0A1T4K5E0_9HYPH|nr:5-formyltetrahydrofolate cyclo-ligase [Enhydrobacter aerosaccus]SJZ37654.1 5-formyltetrahydrofolate cyclo-ligase [Enhydrobacter aerosaccus]
MTLLEDKRALRSVMLAWRAALPEAERRTAAEGLLARFRHERLVETPAVVSGFWPIGEEIDIRPLLMELSGQGCQLALPVVQGKGQRLLFRAWRPGDPLEAGVFGTLHPSAKREAIEPEVLLVPLLACDEEGWRLGYGGGFYDRTLAALRAKSTVTAIGVGFDAQLVAEVPHGPQDQRLDWLLTDRRACAFV